MEGVNHIRIILTAISLAAAASGAPLHAADAGAIRGTVVDESHAVVPGVLVTITNRATGRSVTDTTDSRGSFEVGGLPSGDYRVVTDLAGFRPASADTAVTDGTAATIELTLAVAPLAETLTVTRSGQKLATVPGAVSVVDGSAIQRAQRRVNAAEALTGVPGLLAENRHNFSLSGGVRLAIRAPLQGSGMRGLQLIQDGIPITTADGTNQPTNFALGSAGRAEIIRGPSSVLYGNSAGGVISVFTEFPPAEQLTLQPDIQFGSDGYKRQQVKAGGSLGTFGYVVDASRMTTDGYRAHSAAEVRQANVAVRKAMSSRTEIRGVFNLFDMPFGESASTLARGDALANPRSVRPQAIAEGWGESSQQGQGGFTLEHQFGASQRVRATGWGMWRSTWNPIPSRVIDLDRSGAGFRSEYASAARIGRIPFDVTAGFDVSHQDDHRRERTNLGVSTPGALTREGAVLLDQLERVTSAAPFGEVVVHLHPQWSLTAGARYDVYKFSADDNYRNDGDQSGERTLSAVSPKIGVTWSPAPIINVYSNISTAYQTPTTVELSNRPTGEGGFNEDLGPATIRSVEAGTRGLIPRWHVQYELTGYVSRLDDALVSFQRADEQTFYRNAARSRRDGAEALLLWTPSRALQTRLAYTYQNFRFDEFVTAQGNFSGNGEPGAPPHQIFASGTYTAPFGLYSTLQARWLDSYFVNNANTASDWASTVVDLRFAFDRTWKGLSWQPFLGVDNLLAERYNASSTPNAAGSRYYEPAPGREVYAGLTIGARIK
jgi:iron complex outermembrane receptor protein